MSRFRPRHENIGPPYHVKNCTISAHVKTRSGRRPTLKSPIFTHVATRSGRHLTLKYVAHSYHCASKLQGRDLAFSPSTRWGFSPPVYCYGMSIAHQTPEFAPRPPYKDASSVQGWSSQGYAPLDHPFADCRSLQLRTLAVFSWHIVSRLVS